MYIRICFIWSLHSDFLFLFYSTDSMSDPPLHFQPIPSTSQIMRSMGGGFIPRKLSTISSISQRSTSSGTQKDVPVNSTATPCGEEMMVPVCGQHQVSPDRLSAVAVGVGARPKTSGSAVKIVCQDQEAEPAGEGIMGSQGRTCSCDYIVSPETAAWLASLPKVKKSQQWPYWYFHRL